MDRSLTTPEGLKLRVISREPEGPERATPLLFVHGMFHGAWCWDVHFLDYFARRGFASHAVDLRGHGASEGREGIRWARIRDLVQDVAAVARTLPAPPVLIGHSLGGFVVQKYLERYDAAGAVLLSSPPPSGMGRAALRIARRRPLALARSAATLSLRPLIATPELAREAFFSPQLPAETLQRYWGRLEDDSVMALLDMIALDLPRPRPNATPMLVLAAERDRMLTVVEGEGTARAYGTHAQVIPGAAHDSMLDPQWELAAVSILEWLGTIDPSRTQVESGRLAVSTH